MDVYLGLGSNLGDRRQHLARALEELAAAGMDPVAVSPVVESPALLPDGAPPDWNRPFLNVAARVRTALTAHEALDRIKAIETRLERDASQRWSPRPIDIDILLWGRDEIRSDRLTVPHPALTQRNFVLAPLVALAPRLEIPGFPGKTVLELARGLRHVIPLFMGIVNVTPDSFSDGGELASWTDVDARVDEMLAAGAQIVDVGAESTRPGATPLSADEEWSRLEPILLRLVDKLSRRPLPPLVSVDTYHAAVAQRALATGAAIVNDVGGLTSPDMIRLAAESGRDFVAMHSVTVPAAPGAILPPGEHPADQLRRWLDARLAAWQAAGIDLAHVIFDPGIGFGKNPLQSLDLLRDVARFRPPELRCLVGHSRKSFMRTFAAQSIEDRDLTTVGASLNLCAQGIEILRVHNVPAHARAYRGWAHLLPP